MTNTSSRVEMIPIEAITVANPRVRNTTLHKEITDNIGQIGLKRPITVRRLTNDGGTEQFALICGQGRLESCKALGQSHIAALVVDTDEETEHVMSLVENIARRTPRASEMLERVHVVRWLARFNNDYLQQLQLVAELKRLPVHPVPGENVSNASLR